jgi:hypothetical protein
MRCEQAAEALDDARYGELRSPELLAHLAKCVDCRELEQRSLALDRMLALDRPADVGLGFDTRFFARLADEKARARRTRWSRWSWALVPVAAGLALALVQATAPTHLAPNLPAQSTVLPPSDLDLAMNLELTEDLDVVEKLDEVQDYDLLSQIDDQDLQRIIEEERH